MTGDGSLVEMAAIGLCLVAAVNAYSSFNSNCTLPQEPTNFVSSPPTRGTMDIVWSSVLAIISCTYTIQHLVVPRQVEESEAKDESLLVKILMAPLRYFAGFDWHKFRWSLLTILFPEFIVGKSMAEYTSASYWEKRFQDIAPLSVPELNHQNTDLTVGKRSKVAMQAGRSDAEWTKTHSFLANMRGIVLRFNVNAVPTSLMATKPSKMAIDRALHVPQPDWLVPYCPQDAKQAEAIELEMCRKICGVPCKNRLAPVDQNQPSAQSDLASREQAVAHEKALLHSEETTLKEKEADVGTTISSDTSSTASKPQANDTATLGPHKPWRGAWALSAAQWYHAYEIGLIKHLPAITKDELDDRSKGDYLVKVASVFQIIWLIISIAARAVQDLEISLLEITVVAFAATAVVIYIFFLQKPQDIGIPIYVDAAVTLEREHIIALAARSAASTIIVHEFWLHGVAVRDQAENIYPITPGIEIRTPFRRHPIYINPVIGIGLGSILFGAVHFAAWNFTFPTPVERLLWRISCVLCVVLPAAGALIYYFTTYLGRLAKKSDLKMNYIFKPMEYVLGPCYLLARAFLTAEMLRQLGYLQPSAFIGVDWNAALPHLS